MFGLSENLQNKTLFFNLFTWGIICLYSSLKCNSPPLEFASDFDMNAINIVSLQ